MNSLYDIFYSINESNDRWRYYENANIDTILAFGNSPNENSPAKTIKAYFDAGGKFDLLRDVEDSFESIPDWRAEHILSTFLLGIHFFENIEYIRCAFNDLAETNQTRRTWLYIWFLTCLYHDIGYIYETDSKIHFHKSINSFLPSKLSVQGCTSLKYYELGKNYFAYRKRERVIDHGVIGGFRLYAIMDYIMKSNCADGRNHILNGLLYSTSLEPYYAKAADAIIRHNMWNAPEDNPILCNKYHDFSLDELIGEQRITLEQPFVFLLGLCDSIEPIKRFNFTKAERILKSIEIDVDKNSIELSMPYCLRNNAYFVGIKEMRKWLNVSTPEQNSDSNTIRIELCNLDGEAII